MAKQLEVEFDPSSPSRFMVRDAGSVGPFRAPTDTELELILANFSPTSNPLVDSMVNTEEDLKTMGVKAHERWVFKNLAQDKVAAQEYLKRLGYETKEYDPTPMDELGLSHNFLVRKKSSDPWRPVDPIPTDSFLPDLLFDLLDLTADAIQSKMITDAAISGAVLGGRVGGPAGAALGGVGAAGAMGFMTEGVRQTAGAAAGIPQEPSPMQAAYVGAASAIAPKIISAAGRGLGIIGEGAKDFLMERSANIVGVKGSGGTILPEEALAEFAASGKKRTISPFGAAKRSIESVIEFVKEPRIQDFKDARSIINKVSQDFEKSGQVLAFDLRPLISDIQEDMLVRTGEVQKQTIRRVVTATESVSDAAGTKVGVKKTSAMLPGGGVGRTKVQARVSETAEEATQTKASDVKTLKTVFEPAERSKTPEAAIRRGEEPLLPKQAQAVMEAIDNYMEVADITPDAVPVEHAENIKRMLQYIAKRKGTYRDVPIDKPFNRRVDHWAGMLKGSLEQTLDATGATDDKGRLYSEVMDKLSEKMRLRRNIIKWLGIPSKHRGDAMDFSVATKRIAPFYGTGFGAERRMVRDLELNFPGVEIERHFREAKIGTMVGRQGEVPTSPRFTAVGTLFGAALLGGVAGEIGKSTGMPTDWKTGAAAGGALAAGGILVGSPRANISMVRGAQRLGSAIGPVAPSVSQATRLGLVTAINQAVRNLDRPQPGGLDPGEPEMR